MTIRVRKAGEICHLHNRSGGRREKRTMRIEYEDRELVVIYKEAGLPVQTGRTSRKDAVSLLKNHLAQTAREVSGEKNLGKQGGYAEPYLGIVHRLDQPVEGLLVFAKTPGSAAALSAQTASKDGMEKVYQAVVNLNSASYPLAIEGRKREVTLTDWLGRDFASNTAYIASEGEKGARKAQLSFRTQWIKEGRALLQIRLQTGRHHQIRIQMAHAAMPLVGDRKYGGAADEGERDNSSAAYPLCLCAERNAFGSAVADGKKKGDFKAIAIVGGNENETAASPCFPCGACRQVMAQFCGEDFEVVLTDGTYPLGELLPYSFSL